MTTPPPPAVTLVRTVHTSEAFPSQWDAWDAQGQYYYLRFRHGHGSVHRYPHPECSYRELVDHDPELARLYAASEAAMAVLAPDGGEVPALSPGALAAAEAAKDAAWDAFHARYREVYLVASFTHGNDLDGIISLDDFCRLARLSLCGRATHLSFGEYLREGFAAALAEAETGKDATT